MGLLNSSGDPNQNGQFRATSSAVNIGTPAWGLYANNGNVADARRALPGPLAVGQTLAVKMDNGFLNTGAGTGVALFNAQSNMLWEFFFNGGDQNYSISGGTTDIGWTPGGLDIELTLTGPTSWVARITPLGGSTRTNTGHFVPQANMTATTFRAWNYNAGPGSDFDFFVNDLRVLTPAAGGGYSTGDTVVIVRSAGITDTDGDGIPDAWEIQHYGCATCAVASADSDADGATAWEEYIADTVPTNSASVWTNVIPQIGGHGRDANLGARADDEQPRVRGVVHDEPGRRPLDPRWASISPARRTAPRSPSPSQTTSRCGCIGPA